MTVNDYRSTTVGCTTAVRVADRGAVSADLDAVKSAEGSAAFDDSSLQDGSGVPGVKNELQHLALN